MLYFTEKLLWEIQIKATVLKFAYMGIDFSLILACRQPITGLKLNLNIVQCSSGKLVADYRYQEVRGSTRAADKNFYF